MISIKDIAIKIGPAVAQAMKDTGKLLVKEAVSKASEKAAEGIKKGPEKIDNYIDKKKKEAISDAREEAELFMAQQMEIFEKRVDTKLDEIERRIDEKVRSYYRSFLVLVLSGLAASLLLGFILMILWNVNRWWGALSH
jgi:hypothetical protein